MSFSLTSHRFIHEGASNLQINQFLRNGITLFSIYGEAVPSFLMKESSLMAGSSSLRRHVRMGEAQERSFLPVK